MSGGGNVLMKGNMYFPFKHELTPDDLRQRALNDTRVVSPPPNLPGKYFRLTDLCHFSYEVSPWRD